MILNHDQVLALLPDRDENAHKGNFGRILLLCGAARGWYTSEFRHASTK